MKRCTKCGIDKRFDQFPVRHGKFTSHCKPCKAEAARLWRVNNPGRYDRQQKLKRFKRMGITEEQYFEILEAQSGHCPLCFTTESLKGWAIDHDHSCCETNSSSHPRACGKCVRGLLCEKCNLKPGLFEDKIFMERAAAYLSSPPARRVLDKGKE